MGFGSTIDIDYFDDNLEFSIYTSRYHNDLSIWFENPMVFFNMFPAPVNIIIDGISFTTSWGSYHVAFDMKGHHLMSGINFAGWPTIEDASVYIDGDETSLISSVASFYFREEDDDDDVELTLSEFLAKLAVDTNMEDQEVEIEYHYMGESIRRYSYTGIQLY